MWRQKRILITGSSGFLGSHLTNRLKALKAQVIGFDSTDGDVGDFQTIDSLFKHNHFHYCFHLAAQPLVDIASTDPTPTFNTNIKGTWNILEAARKYHVKGTIIASTSHVYGKNHLPFLEKYFPKPSRPYETSKACADMLAQTYASYYSLPVAIARCVNIYGPGDNHMRIVPQTIQLLLKGKHPQVYSDQTTRDYMFITDAIDAYILLAEKLPQLRKKNDNIIFNFGTGKHYRNITIVKKITKLLNMSTNNIAPLNKKRKQEIEKQYVSIKKARQILGWNPKYTLTKGLRETIAWYQNSKQL